MKNVLFSFFCIIAFFHLQAQLEVTEIGALPEAVSNNAVCEGYVNGIPYLFSFSGIDTSKVYSGIHLKSFRYNITTGQSEQIGDLPDNNGKIAAGASRIGNIIYIAGGYHVAANGSETSSAKMHRYDINNNVFLTDGADIPVATDDHVQAVWRDSLIYLITGWSNTGNIPDVQIYNPTTDTWLVGTPTPNNHQYKSFGASGTILDDTIFYFGGAASSAGFGIQNQVRKGVINPIDPTDITWSIDTPEIAIVGYRMACTSVKTLFRVQYDSKNLPTWLVVTVLLIKTRFHN
ncbi:MAG: Kelch repeat-containing protein, partial [Chitinophagales bacterium]